MARTPSNFGQSDLSRTLRACKDAGVLDRVVVRVEKGVFMIMPVGTASSILTKDRAQFALQRREGKTSEGFPRWTSRSFCKSKAVLFRDVTRFAGKVDPMARLVLDALPSEASHVNVRA